MDFASLMAAQIAEAKGSTPPEESSSNSKALRRAEAEAQRQAQYLAEQRAEEEAREARVEKKRKAKEEEEEREFKREEKRRRLAEQSRKLREEEAEEKEKARRKRLGLPELPPKGQREGSGTPALEEGEEDIVEEELIAKLREIKEPAYLFGESHAQRLRRYRRIANAPKLSDGPIPTTLEPVPGGEMLVPPKVSKDAKERKFLFRQLASYFNMVLQEWEVALAKRPADVQQTTQGKQAYNAMVQAKENLRPLFRRMEKSELEDDILQPVVEIVKAAQERRYVDANDGYLTLSIGKAAWPIGVTMESYFTYGAEGESPVNHDVHFRPGVATDGSDTFMPRTVVYDLKGGFGSLRRVNALYDPGEGEGDALCAYQQALDAGLEPPPLNTDTVRYWSDYSRVYYHPRSLVQLHEYELNARLMPFERWDAGEELFSDLDREHDLLDRDLRPFVEECDQLQGLQMMTSVDDAWGGFCGKYLERLRDEFGKLSIWVWALENEESKVRERKLVQLANNARSIFELSSQASAYIPISNTPFQSPPYLHLNPSSRWHTSALQAAAIESITLPSRLRTSHSSFQTLSSMEATFNNNGNQKVAAPQMSVADPDSLAETLRETLADRDARAAKKTKSGNEDSSAPETELNALDMDLEARKEHVFGRAETLRGAWETPDVVEERNAAARDRRFAQGPVVQRYHTPLLFPVLDSYPHIFNVTNDANGSSPKALAVQASLSTSSAIATRLRYLGGVVPRLVSIEDRETLSNGLKTMAEEYEEGWESGLEDSDEDDDE
ncbi:tubulin nucleotide-binding domain-like protein [Saccharata proteae CBS 121410]|uniref:Tubulin nucleotide-binding domain-like protein n=1 Tax=Saccharata proteae CBS 121410 TaxID=1314787 RepID=A0A9P4LV49_9PEZI|nr:tubulin nucleotide-binding domain-like protein [Saccharata proteae CBS 121410]